MMDAEDKYSQDFFDEIYPSGYLKKFSINWWSVRFYALLSQRLLGKRKARVFDFGCGLPFILARLEKRYETWGMDISPYAIEKGKDIAPRSKILAANLEEEIPERVPRNFFDLILAKYIFEHLRDPGEAMHRCTELLRQGGVLLTSVPNMESAGRRWKGEEWYAFKDKTHISLLSPEQWLSLVKKNGLHVEQYFSDGYWDIPYLKKVPQWLQYFIFSIPCAIEVFFVWPFIPPRYGENIIIIARKV